MATFLETHADMVNNKDQHGDALVHFAARAHAVDVLQVLHDHGADLGAVNEHGRQPLHEAIDSVDCVAYLVKQGNVDVNALKRGDWTPLMSAALKGNLDIIKILEQAGAQLDRITKDGRTALHLAIQNGHVETAQYLAEHSPSSVMTCTKSGRLPAQLAAALSPPEISYAITSFLLSNSSWTTSILNHRDNSGRGVLIDAAVARSFQLLKSLLLDYDADPNQTDSIHRSMIHYAAMMGHLDTLELLYHLRLPKDIQWDVPDSWDQWTPLLHAAREGHEPIVRFLLENKLADISWKDKRGRTAYDLANTWNHRNICEYLQDD